MKKIRKKKKPVPKTPAGEEGMPALLKRMESFIRGNYQRAAVLGIVILFGIIFVPVYICYSYRRQNEAARVLERAFAIEFGSLRRATNLLDHGASWAASRGGPFPFRMGVLP